MNTDTQFAGSIPAVYESHLVPLIFEPYAADLAARLSDLSEGVLLEIAAGTGVVTRVLLNRLPETVRVLATDLNPDMLSIGARRVSRPNLTWQQADARQLPFEAASVAAIVCQFGMMFMPDKVAAYGEARRVLRPEGRFLFNVWNRVELNEVTAVVGGAVAGLFPDDPPQFLERTPFGYFDVAVIRRDLEDAGFRRIEIETVEKSTTARSAQEAAIGLCQGTPLRGEIEARDPARLDEAVAAAASALTARFGAGSFENRMSAHVISAWS